MIYCHTTLKFHNKCLGTTRYPVGSTFIPYPWTPEDHVNVIQIWRILFCSNFLYVKREEHATQCTLNTIDRQSIVCHNMLYLDEYTHHIHKWYGCHLFFDNVFQEDTIKKKTVYKRGVDCFDKEKEEKKKLSNICEYMVWWMFPLVYRIQLVGH